MHVCPADFQSEQLQLQGGLLLGLVINSKLILSNPVTVIIPTGDYPYWYDFIIMCHTVIH